MTRLYLLRHGIAVPHGTPGVPEDDRPLTAKGEKRVRQVARGLVKLELEPDRIVTSPLPRAHRTAEIVAEVLGLEDRLEVADVLRGGAGAPSIREWLRGRQEPELMLVGHNPDLTDLLGLLIGVSANPLPFELKKGGVAALQSDDGEHFSLTWLATPRLIRRLPED
jgi:phosphohistidine phosphatase